jgi:hypothetical protein
LTGYGLRLHHVGCLVANLEEALAGYVSGPLAQPVTQPLQISANQRVRVAFVGEPQETLIELVEPGPDNGFLQKLLKRGITFYHLGYLAEDLPAAEERFLESGAHVVARFQSEAFDGRECVFFLTVGGQMIELIDASKPGARRPL